MEKWILGHLRTFRVTTRLEDEFLKIPCSLCGLSHIRMRLPSLTSSYVSRAVIHKDEPKGSHDTGQEG